MIKLIVCGACGKMGERILSLAMKDRKFEIVAAVEKKGHPEIGKPVPGSNLVITDSIDKIINKSDVLIDFTSPETSLLNGKLAAKNNKSIVIGTTGFSQDELARLKGMLKPVSAVISPNMSFGVNLLFNLVKKTAKTVPDYDIEIIEMHHNQKKDSPSGTANKLGEIITAELNRDLNKVGVYGRKGIIGARTKNEIGILSVRAGDIVGEHTVIFAGPGERIELTHRAHSRDTLAVGALHAAKWAVKQPPGIYSMDDVLGLK